MRILRLCSCLIGINNAAHAYLGIVLLMNMMKAFTIISGVCCVSLLAILAGCDRKPAPLKEGVIWKVEWESAGTWTGLFREPRPPNINSNYIGQFGVDMQGALYPGFLELSRVGSQNTPSQIIPLSQIRRLEFGDGGVSLNKP